MATLLLQQQQSTLRRLRILGIRLHMFASWAALVGYGLRTVRPTRASLYSLWALLVFAWYMAPWRATSRATIAWVIAHAQSNQQQREAGL